MRTHVAFVLAIITFLGCEGMPPELTAEEVPTADFYVATNGNDSWSGKLPAPNAEKTDGPFATLHRARDAVRQITPKMKDITIIVRRGTYYLSEPLAFGAEDSGNENCTISYMACPGEEVVLSGGRRITGWKPFKGNIYVADIPKTKAGRWHIRQLFADGRRQIRARFPNLDQKEPFRKGFLYVDSQGFGRSVGCIHNKGDWMEYKIDVPADGAYGFWVLYAAQNKPFGRTDMAGRTAISMDGGAPIPLMNLPDTGNWHDPKWARSATVPLKKGPHMLKWENVQGGGLNLAAFVLCDDPKWKPQGIPLKRCAPDKHLILIQAAGFTASYGRQLRVSTSSGSGSKTYIVCKPGTAKQVWAQAPDSEIHIFPSGRHTCRAFKIIVNIEGVTPDGSGIRVKPQGSRAHVMCAGDRYFVENVFEELDSPGEWYLDTRKGRLYYWPEKTPPSQSRIVAPVLGRVIEFLGDAKAKTFVRHIRLSGLVIQENDYSPNDGSTGYGMGTEGTVYLQAAENCAIDHCRFLNIGKNAVYAADSAHNQFADNEIAYSAEGGVVLYNTRDTTVSNNHIHHIGAVYKHVGGVVLERGSCDNVVSHNRIHDSSRYGISLKNPGKRNLIEYNKVYDLNLETYDTGGIEVTQGDKDFRSESVIRYNIVHDTGGYSSIFEEPKFCSWGIYLDSYAGGYEVCNNIVWRNSHGGIMIQGGKDNNVHNNIFVGGTRQQMQFNNFRDNSTGNRFFRNIVYYDEPDALLISAGRLDQKAIQSDYNLYFHTGGKPLVVRIGGVGERPFAEWQKRGFDVHSLVADPMFEDVSKEDFRLKPDSPALKLGFKPIPVGEIGILPKRKK